MAEPTAHIARTFTPDDPGALNLRNPYNLSGIFDPTLTARVDYYVHLYTVSKREFIVRRPPLIPSLTIPACSEERYKFVCSIPHPCAQVDRDPLHGNIIFYDRGASHDGRRVAMDVCNPDNLSLNQDWNPPRGQRSTSLGYGVNLSEKGVFWSLAKPPSEEEIKAAELRIANYYRRILDEAQSLAVGNPALLQQVITEDYHLAADFYGVETSWHMPRVAKVVCPYCAEQVRPGAKYHKNSELGNICVIDVDGAESSGAITAKQAELLRKARGIKVHETVETKQDQELHGA